jgi:ABC-type branched-subunit amino acid transport system substrate-binding protein
MTSVQNRPLPLSGNKILLVLISCLFIIACSTGRKTSVIKSTQKKLPTTKEVDEEITKSKAKSDKDILVDTINWVLIPDEISKPIVVPDTDSGTAGTLRALAYLPLNAANYQPDGNSDERFIQYYAGMQLALKDVQPFLSKSIELQIIDVEKDKDFKRHIETYNPDLIFGSNDRKELQSLAEIALDKKIPLVSPWFSSSTAASDNPYYIQLKPNLRDHFEKIVADISSKYKPEKIVFIGRDNRVETAWFNYFEELAAIYFNKKDINIQKHFVTLEELISSVNEFGEYISKGSNVFIFPHYTTSDEDYLFSALRRLSADKGNEEVIVYAMPIALESEKIDFSYYSTVNLKVVVPEFLDESSDQVTRFYKSFYQDFGTLPDRNAVEGYDKTFFILKNFSKHGKNLASNLHLDKSEYLQTSFNVQRVVTNIQDRDKFDKIDFYENKNLFIVEFVDGKFRKRN